MADLKKAKDVVKEKLLGTETEAEVQLSALSRATFDKNARKDEASGELIMLEDDFINAIAPEGEDYVSQLVCLSHKTLLINWLTRHLWI
jgi:solute carrier family 25 aspartate/glutamate transporter 12/13